MRTKKTLVKKYICRLCRIEKLKSKFILQNNKIVFCRKCSNSKKRSLNLIERNGIVFKKKPLYSATHLILPVKKYYKGHIGGDIYKIEDLFSIIVQRGHSEGVYFLKEIKGDALLLPTKK